MPTLTHRPSFWVPSVLRWNNPPNLSKQISSLPVPAVIHPVSRFREVLISRSNRYFVTPAVIITDQEYPVRPAFSLLTKLLDDFIAKVPQSSFANPAGISFPELKVYLDKYQDPRQADNIMRVQQELDETKIILVSNLSFAFPVCGTLTELVISSTRRSTLCCSVGRS